VDRDLQRAREAAPGYQRDSRSHSRASSDQKRGRSSR
jgi:hypothetical protein